VLSLPNDVLFDSGRVQIKPAGRDALAEVSAALKPLNERHFQVAGHTDNVLIDNARFASNWELSTQRAVEVVRFMTAQGVAPEALSAAGYSEYDPVAPNATPEGKAKNRRVEITLVPNVDELVRVPER
jgi:chemotaxis protein MotB